MSESEMVAAERQEARPPHRTEADVRAEAHYSPDEHAVTIHPNRCACGKPKPCADDPWTNQCHRCEEFFEEPGCAHGRTLCPSCAPFCCEICETEEADAANRAEEIRREWWGESA